MTLTEKIRACIERHPKHTDGQIAKNCGCRAADVTAARGGAKAAPSSSGRSLGDFRKVFDVPLRIRDGVKRHLAGCYMTDQEFRDACGIHVGLWRRYADLDEFKPCQGRFSGQLLWAQPKMMGEMKHIAGIPQEV